MSKRHIILAAMLTLAPLAVHADLDDWTDRGSTGRLPADPEMEAFGFETMILLGVSCALFGLGGALLIPAIVRRTRRIRDTFWVLPLLNLFYYAVSIYVLPFPGGVRARFHSSHLVDTLAQILLLILLSVVLATMLAAVGWSRRWARRRRAVVEPDARDDR